MRPPKWPGRKQRLHSPKADPTDEISYSGEAALGENMVSARANMVNGIRPAL